MPTCSQHPREIADKKEIMEELTTYDFKLKICTDFGIEIKEEVRLYYRKDLKE